MNTIYDPEKIHNCHIDVTGKLRTPLNNKALVKTYSIYKN